MLIPRGACDTLLDTSPFALQVRLIKPGSWKTLWQHELNPGEEATSIRAVNLKNARTGRGCIARVDLNASHHIVCVAAVLFASTTSWHQVHALQAHTWWWYCMRTASCVCPQNIPAAASDTLHLWIPQASGVHVAKVRFMTAIVDAATLEKQSRLFLCGFDL